MYLAMLQKEETKLAFLEMAYLLSITDVRDDSSDYAEEQQEAGFLGMMAHRAISNNIDSEHLNKIQSLLAMKKSEIATLRLYAEELKTFSLDDQEKLHREVDRFIKQAVVRFIEVSETKNEKLINNQDLRVDFVKDTISKIFEDNSILEVSASEKKVIIFELVGMAYADSSISQGELSVLEDICDKLDVDPEFIEDAKDLVSKMTDLQRQGLEIINE